MSENALVVLIDESGHSGRRLDAPGEPEWLSHYAVAVNQAHQEALSDRLSGLGTHSPKHVKGKTLMKSTEGRDLVLGELEGIKASGGAVVGALVNKVYSGCALISHTLLDGENNPAVSLTALDLRGEFLFKHEALQWYAKRIAGMLYKALRDSPELVQDYFYTIHGDDSIAKRHCIDALCEKLETAGRDQPLTIGSVLAECEVPKNWQAVIEERGRRLPQESKFVDLLTCYDTSCREVESKYSYAPQVQALSFLAQQLSEVASKYETASVFHDRQLELMPHMKHAVEQMKRVDARGDIWSQTGRSEWVSSFEVGRKEHACLIGLADWGASLVRWIATVLTSPEPDQVSVEEANIKMRRLLKNSPDAVMALASVDQMRLLFSDCVD